LENKFEKNLVFILKKLLRKSRYIMARGKIVGSSKMELKQVNSNHKIVTTNNLHLVNLLLEKCGN